MSRPPVFLLLFLLSLPVRAGVVSAPAAGAGIPGAPSFAAAAQPWADSFSGFGRWLDTPAGFAARQAYPFLGHLPGLAAAPRALAVAVAPLARRLPEAARAQLADPAALSPAQQADLLSAVAAARSAAAPEAAALSAQAVAAARAAEGAGPEALGALAGEVKGYSLYGGAARHDYKTLRRMATLKAMRLAGDGARVLLREDWDADDFAPDAAPAPAPRPARRHGGLRPAAALLPPSAYYDGGHWSPALVPDRRYARTLEAAVELLAPGDKAETPAAAASALARQRLADTLRAKDPKIHSHMMRVGLMAGLIAARMGFKPTYQQRVAWGARIHDIGKREEPILGVVNKEGRLTPEERGIMERHPEEGAAIILADPGLDPLSRRAGRRAALNHHETLDGTGYPHGLSGEDIPMESRITSVADFFDALMENRPYRAGMSVEQALAVMAKVKEKFDPAAWKAFLGIVAVPAPVLAQAP